MGTAAGIWVRIDTQQLLLVRDCGALATYRCSTAKAGPGSQRGSEKTPIGWHRIAARIGDGLEIGAVLKGRKWTGEVWSRGQVSEGDLILSRVLWLKGLQEGLNLGGQVDSWDRFIYIHGTNQVTELGRPASHGCVRLDPEDVIELFDAVDVACPVLITG